MDIHALHTDILIHIFHAVAANEPPHFMHVPLLNTPDVRKAMGAPDESRDERLGWVRLGHVGRSWRIILLSLQTLWAEHIGLLPVGVDEMLARAGATTLLKLHLPLGLRTARGIQKLDELLRNQRDVIRSRLQAISVWDPSPFLGQGKPLPRRVSALMASMAVARTSQGHGLFPFDILESVLLSDELPALRSLDLIRHSSSLDELPVVAPNLRHLRLRNCTISCPQSVHLVALTLVRTKDGRRWNDQPKMTLKAALKFLEQSSASLQHVELSNVFDDIESPELLFSILVNGTPIAESDPPINRTVELPALQTLTVRDTSSNISDLLNCLRYSRNVMTQVDPRHTDPFFNTQDTTDMSIHAAIVKYTDCHVAGLRFHEQSKSRGSIDVYDLSDGSATRLHGIEWYRMRTPILTVSADFSAHTSNPSTIAKIVASELSVAGIDVKALALDLRSSIAQEKVLEMMQCAPNAHSLCVETYSMAFSSIAHALRQYVTGRDSHQLYKTISLIASVEPTAITNLALMSIAFAQSRADTISLYIDERYKEMSGGEKAAGYLDELSGVFREIVLYDYQT